MQIRGDHSPDVVGLDIGSASCRCCDSKAEILSSIMEISTSSLSIFSRSISAYCSFVRTVTGLKLFSLIRLQNPCFGPVLTSPGVLYLLAASCPKHPKRDIMMAPGTTLDRPRVTKATAPPVKPPAMELALTRSDGVCCFEYRASIIPPRIPQKVVPNAKVWTPDATPNRKGAVPLMIPAAPPTRNPAPPVLLR